MRRRCFSNQRNFKGDLNGNTKNDFLDGPTELIVNPRTGGGLMNLFSTHPALEERIRRLEEMVTRVG